MENDLISRKAVIELIENCHVLEDAYCLIDYINELPIAYDFDRVIQQLEKHEKEIGSRKERDILNTIAKANAKATVEEDIEIVKSGFLMNDKRNKYENYKPKWND